MAQERKGVFFITDPPPSFDFGIDCMNYETQSQFKGICMIPEGFHFIYYSTGMGSRQGFFLFYSNSNSDIIVKSWDPIIEDILPSHNLSDWSFSNLLQSINRGEVDSNLGPYPIETHKSWINLSNFITLQLFKLVNISIHTPILPGDLIEPQSKSQNNSSTFTSVSSAIQPYFPSSARIIQYCNIKQYEQEYLQLHSQQFKENKTQLTFFYLDRSNLLEYLLEHYYKSFENFLGELQLSFLMFMLLFSHSALEHWKQLISLICSSERILFQFPKFSCEFLRIFFSQLQYSPDDFFETEISYHNFLRPSFSSLFENLGKEEMDENVREHRNRLFTFTQKKFGLYSNEKEEMSGSERFILVEEDMPVIVSEQEIQLLTEMNNEEEELMTEVEEIKDERDDDKNNEVNLQEQLFSWRYPLLYDEMKRYNRINEIEKRGGEDLIMTAMRLVDENDEISDSSNNNNNNNRDNRKQLREEAIRFIEQEIILQNKR